MHTARLHEAVRQKEPELKEAVEQLTGGHIQERLRISTSRATCTRLWSAKRGKVQSLVNTKIAIARDE